ncbi:MAG: DUF4254 domain-containing protein [Owenweeksia sp.]|nr:DUF4254 domain-containing protein [Owenweeksia sp.]
MKASDMNRIFDQCIDDYHLRDDVNAAEQNPFAKDTLEYLLYHKAWIDTVQWHLEDIIRDPAIKPEKALEVKRAIDHSNQNRTDQVEKIDDFYLEKFAGTDLKKNARINTESPAWAIDRLSILALKLYHMEKEAGRKEANQALKQKNHGKLKVLQTQRQDLSLAIDQLLEDLAQGNRIMKVYRQMKMYNDPDLNPVLYGQKDT